MKQLVIHVFDSKVRVYPDPTKLEAFKQVAESNAVDEVALYLPDVCIGLNKYEAVLYATKHYWFVNLRHRFTSNNITNLHVTIEDATNV